MTSRSRRRRTLRLRKPVVRLSWRPRQADDVLEDVPGAYGGTLKGEDRCRAVGLENADCPLERWPGSAYCYYHDKLRLGLTEPHAQVYPVWPLPDSGYVLIREGQEIAA